MALSTLLDIVRQRIAPRAGAGGCEGTRSIVYGLIAGAHGAACMSVLRLAARRGGLIDKMPPQALSEWVSRRADIEPPAGDIGHHVLDHLLHLGVGLIGGGAYGALFGRRPSFASGALHGLGIWAAGFLALMPLLGVTRSAANAESRENAVNVGAHLVYGLVLALMVQEMCEQRRRVTSRAERYAARVG